MNQREREGRRTAAILTIAQAILGSAAPISISMGGLAGIYLLDADKSLATAPVTGYTAGVAVGALPAAFILRLVGQRYGFIVGSLITGAGGGLAAIALFVSNFWLLVLAMIMVGIGGAFVQRFRFAAADNAPAEFKARAISWVLAGGVGSAILGPQIVIFTREAFAPVMFAGAYAAIVGLALAGAFVLSFLRLSRDAPAEQSAAGSDARPLWEIVRQPRFAVALLTGVGSYALMTFVMTGAPLAMVGCGFTPDEATLGISWHVMAMFAPSFITGRLIARYGKETIVAIGLALLIACAVVALSGLQLWQFWGALILLGVGWNFGFIGSTAMVTEAYRPSEKNKVQGFHDFVLFTTVAFASLMAGQVYNAWGWNMLAWTVFPVVAICLGALGLWLVLARRGRDTSLRA